MAPPIKLWQYAGVRFGVKSDEYRILRTWIAAGAAVDPPGAPVLRSLTVTPAEQYIVQPKDVVVFREGPLEVARLTEITRETNALVHELAALVLDESDPPTSDLLP